MFVILLLQIDGNSVQVQLVALWTITAMSTMSGMTSTCFSVILKHKVIPIMKKWDTCLFSAVSGIGVGVRRLSEVCFVVGLLLLVSVFLLDRTEYLANLGVQSVG